MGLYVGIDCGKCTEKTKPEKVHMDKRFRPFDAWESRLGV